MKFSAIFVAISAILIVFASDQAQAQKQKVVCYFTNWSWYRQGNGKFSPENIDANLCTHIVYGFTVLDPNSLTIKVHDSWADIDNHMYKKVTDFRQKGIKVTVAMGGWNDSIGSKYGRLLTDAGARRKFITNVMDFIKKHNFQGLDLDLEVSLFCLKGPFFGIIDLTNSIFFMPYSIPYVGKELVQMQMQHKKLALLNLYRNYHKHSNHVVGF